MTDKKVNFASTDTRGTMGVMPPKSQKIKRGINNEISTILQTTTNNLKFCCKSCRQEKNNINLVFWVLGKFFIAPLFARQYNCYWNTLYR